MKTLRILGLAATLTGLALVNSAANAIVIGTTEVGSFDQFKCADNLGNSSEAGEEAFIESCTGVAVTYTKALDLSAVTSIGGNNFIDVSPLTPGFFLLKYGAQGGPSSTANDTFVFANLADLMYLVWADSTIIANGGGTNPNGQLLGLSHYAFTGNVPNEPNSPTVPEPGTLALLGLGLLGLGGARSFRRS